jgi:excinuclease ABC subunit A
MPSQSAISIRGARCHNLKNIDLDIPLGSLTVITGVSGSGKSSLAFDTLYAEGQRRYVETFSPYTRQFLERMDKPPVDRIDGIPPAIALSQANSIRSSRSTVGTLTEIADYLKLLFARKAKLHSPATGREIRPWKPEELADQLIADYSGRSILIGADISFAPKTKWGSIVSTLSQQGIIRHWTGQSVERLAEDKAHKARTIQAVLTRLEIKKSNHARISESLDHAFRLSGESQTLWIISENTRHPSLSAEASAKAGPATGNAAEKVLFTSSWTCPDSEQSFTAPSPALFTFNNPLGACPQCRGFGRTVEIDYELALPDRNLSVGEGVVKPFQTEANHECQEDLERACKRKKVPLGKPFRELTAKQQKFIIEGEPGTGYRNRWYGVKGFFEWLESRTYKVHVRVLLSRYRAYRRCPACQGRRFQPELEHWTIDNQTLGALNEMPIENFDRFAQQLKASDKSEQILIDQIRSRAEYLNRVGLGYLNLNRAARTLSGGEIQRVNLTTCMGSSLVGSLFVLDEPSIGLHPRDTTQLIEALQELTYRGNTTIVVEHDDQFMKAADQLIELGPAAGMKGGKLVAQGHWTELMTSTQSRSRKSKARSQKTKSLTGEYLSGQRTIPLPNKRRPIPARHPCLKIEGASMNNIRDLDVTLPLQRFVAISGVSGSGKSTLLHHLVYQQIKKRMGHSIDEPGTIRKMTGVDQIRDIHIVDQSPLTKTPRSTPLLYLGCYDDVRNLFAQTDLALRRGLRASSFSFNSGDGRCTRCQGTGFEKISMQFLSDLYVTCPICEGKRFQKHVLQIRWRDRSIHDVLTMTVDDAIPFFKGGISAKSASEFEKSDKLQSKACENILSQLTLLQEVGLGYLRLGQPLTHLSGGEAQRLKLISHLASAFRSPPSAPEDKHTILILDEPTTGLHFADIEVLLRLLHRMVDEGISLFVIEHNLDLIKGADHVIDLGPEAGDAGGRIVASGTPEKIAGVKSSHTGRYLKAVLNECKPVKYSNPSVPSLQVSGFRPQPSRDHNVISVRGARHHNLKGIDADIPRDAMVVLTGLSGSGKSTLAFDLLFSEGQRRYLDCLNTYARQFIEQLEKPDVDAILGLPPTVAIEQRTTRGGAKSTVATVTELYHFLRLLYSKIGVQHDPETGELAIQQSAQEIISRIRHSLGNSKKELALLAPLVKNRKGIYNEIGRWAVRRKLPYLRVDGEWIPPDQFTALDRYREHSIDAVLGNTSARDPQMEVMINQALALGNGTLYTIDDQSRQTLYSTELFCPGSGRSFEPLDPRLFSYNSPYGWCPECQGYGTRELNVRIDPKLEGAEREAAIESALEQLSVDSNNGDDASTPADPESVQCPDCGGTRLNEVARAVKLEGRSVTEWNHLSVDAFARAFNRLKFSGRKAEIARDILPEIQQRLKFLQQVGLGYLQLDRSATTLSGGEGQRIRLAAQLGSNLQGVLYILDEPTIGLHPRDNRQLLEILNALKERGNSLVVVEHDEDTMKDADEIIDLGPGAGINGGEIVAQGHWTELTSSNQSGRQNESATATLLGEPIQHPLRGHWRPIPKNHPHIAISGACANNLKDLEVRIPHERLVVFSGVSGSGKSTLLHEVIRPAVESSIKKTRNPHLSRRSKAKAELATRNTYQSVSGADHFDRVLEITQAPIGKTSRSTVATYIGLMDHLRNLYASIPLAKTRGFNKSYFSYNAGKGRCPSCQGQGTIKVEMNFLPATYIPCEQCQGRRWTDAVLEVEFQGKTIYDTLELSVDEAAELFANQPKVSVALQLLQETGLGYLKIGQTSPTLSGGEAQRLKLVAELAVAELTRQRHLLKSSNPNLPRNLYLLEEPTVGLHLADVRKLIDLLHRLVDAGHTVIVIEHHLDVIAEADIIIDIGPESGDAGGRIVAQGPPRKLAASKRSHTAPFLKEVLERSST